MSGVMAQSNGNPDRVGSDRVRRFLDRTFISIAEHEHEHEHEGERDNGHARSSVHSDSTGSIAVLDGDGSSASLSIEKRTSTASNSVNGGHDDFAGVLGDGAIDDNHGHSNQRDEPPKASLLGLPFELRAVILELVLESHNFLSSRQQLEASCSTMDNGVKEIQAVDSQRYKQQDTKLSRFMHRSVLFRGYSTSRHADTAILFTCRQLRDEGIHLWYANKYYLSLVIEQGQYDSLHDVDGSDDERNLRFDPSNQENFWMQIARTLHFPSLQQANRFKKFHLSLFVEQSAFEGIDRRTGVPDGGLPSRKIVDILMGSGTRTDHQPDKASNLDDGADMLNSENQLENLRFLDHTYLGLACDAIDDANPGANTGLQGDDVLEKDTKLSFSVEMWRVA